MKKIVTDTEFAAWCAALKPCRYCDKAFVGPVCPCEWAKLTVQHSSKTTRP